MHPVSYHCWQGPSPAVLHCCFDAGVGASAGGWGYICCSCRCRLAQPDQPFCSFWRILAFECPFLWHAGTVGLLPACLSTKAVIKGATLLMLWLAEKTSCVFELPACAAVELFFVIIVVDLHDLHYSTSPVNGLQLWSHAQ